MERVTPAHGNESFEGYELSTKVKPFESCIAIWEQLSCPYEKALALFEGTEDDKRQALIIIQSLGASAVYEKMKMEMRAPAALQKFQGVCVKAQKTNPAQLTNRELDVLQLLHKTGIQNKEIAANTFYFSPKQLIITFLRFCLNWM